MGSRLTGLVMLLLLVALSLLSAVSANVFNYENNVNNLNINKNKNFNNNINNVNINNKNPSHDEDVVAGSGLVAWIIEAKAVVASLFGGVPAEKERPAVKASPSWAPPRTRVDPLPPAGPSCSQLVGECRARSAQLKTDVDEWTAKASQLQAVIQGLEQALATSEHQAIKAWAEKVALEIESAEQVSGLQEIIEALRAHQTVLEAQVELVESNFLALEEDYGNLIFALKWITVVVALVVVVLITYYFIGSRIVKALSAKAQERNLPTVEPTPKPRYAKRTSKKPQSEPATQTETRPTPMRTPQRVPKAKTQPNPVRTPKPAAQTKTKAPVPTPQPVAQTKTKPTPVPTPKPAPQTKPPVPTPQLAAQTKTKPTPVPTETHEGEWTCPCCTFVNIPSFLVCDVCDEIRAPQPEAQTETKPTPVPAPQPVPQTKPPVPAPLPTPQTKPPVPAPQPTPQTKPPVPAPLPTPQTKPPVPAPLPTPQTKPPVPTPLPVPQTKPNEEDKWTCPRCTFVNILSFWECNVCDESRVPEPAPETRTMPTPQPEKPEPEPELEPEPQTPDSTGRCYTSLDEYFGRRQTGR